MGSRGASATLNASRASISVPRSKKYQKEFDRMSGIAQNYSAEQLRESIDAFTADYPNSAFQARNKEYGGAPLDALKAEAAKRGKLSVSNKSAVNKELGKFNNLSKSGDLAGGKASDAWQRAVNKFTPLNATTEQTAKINQTLRSVYNKKYGEYPVGR